jgi:hypothetical protein
MTRRRPCRCRFGAARQLTQRNLGATFQAFFGYQMFNEIDNSSWQMISMDGKNDREIFISVGTC